MPGRRPKPTHLRLVTGNPGKRRINRNEPQPRRQIPSPPAHLSDRAKVAWGAVSVMLDRMGVLTEADALALERLCETYAELLEAQATIRAEGRYQRVETKSGGVMIRLHPAVGDAADADRRLRAWLVEFGKTPAARAKLKVDDGSGKADPAESYFG